MPRHPKKTSYENIFKSETLLGPGCKKKFWNQRTAGSLFQHFGIRDPPVISKPTKSWWGFRFLTSAVLLSIGK
jgi:hypothetical protein